MKWTLERTSMYRIKRRNMERENGIKLNTLGRKQTTIGRPPKLLIYLFSFALYSLNLFQIRLN